MGFAPLNPTSRVDEHWSRRNVVTGLNAMKPNVVGIATPMNNFGRKPTGSLVMRNMLGFALLYPTNGDDDPEILIVLGFALLYPTYGIGGGCRVG